MRRRFAVASASLLVAFAACNEVESYVFVARRYNADAACLESYTSLDLIHGSGAASTCGATCFRFQGAIYTTRVCPPLPQSAEELDPESPECRAANVPELEDSGCNAVLAEGPTDGGDDDDDAGAVDAGSGGG